jgi:hypothetical protein
MAKGMKAAIIGISAPALSAEMAIMAAINEMKKSSEVIIEGRKQRKWRRNEWRK